MLILQVLTEYKANTVDRPFSYLYYGKKKVGKGYRVLIRFNGREIVGYVLSVQETNKTKEQLEDEMGFSFETIIDVLDAAPLLNNELFELVDRISDYYLASKILVLQKMLPSSLAPKKSSFNGPAIKYEDYVRVVDYSEEDLTTKQIELLKLIYREKEVRTKDISSKSVLEKLIEKQLVEKFKKEVRRFQIPDFEYKEPPELTDDQKTVISSFINNDKKITLLKGVTGSGKTEVYLNVIEHYLKQGKGAIFLVPEISLTPMMMEYLVRRFKGNVAILHGELTPGERYDEYRKIANGDANVVIGTRSAIFAPVQNLGLVIIDEEHVESYKQDVEPFYHAREVAIMRSEITGAKVLLGSATPSLETETRARTNVYQLLTLNKRINQRALPSTQIVNLLDSKNVDRDSTIFSLPLRRAIKDTILRGEQVILLLNRRGFSTNVTCRNCGHVFKCEKCGIALTYHKEDNMLKCHHCESVEEYPTICPECGSHYFTRTGFGCEKVEEEVHRLFPEAKTVRIDADTTKVRNKIPSLIESFRKKETNIMIGTQMIAKGHDFPGVSLVGIVLADIGLNMPSYRSSERAFQLITQAIGRCGRGNIPGKAIIQTYDPTNYAIALGASQNYTQFYLTELSNRKLRNYPPYARLCSFVFRARNENNALVNANYAIELLNEKFGKLYHQVLGPLTPFYSYRDDMVERQVLVKYKDALEARKIFKEIKEVFKYKSSVEISINMDPYNF